MVYSSVVLYFFFVDASVFWWFGSCCVGPFGGWCRRRLIVVLVDCSYVTHGGHGQSVGGGLFLMGDVAGACASRGVHWDLDRVLYDGVCVGMWAAYLMFV